LRLDEYNKIINSKLEGFLSENGLPQKRIYEAARYSLMAGGKRIRPVLALSVSEILGGEAHSVLPFACAIELIHTYSLIHDDLPAMDNDDFRRGKLTNHKVFGEGVAVLAGDALLNKAFEIMAETLTDSVMIERKIKAIQEVAAASGIEGMIGGQMLDIDSKGKQMNEEDLRCMHSLKTGRLITAAAVVGAIMSGGSEQDLEKIRCYARNLGLAFQIKDDILSEIGEQVKLGKKAGDDRENNKSTYVTILGLQEAQRLLNETTIKAVESLKSYKEKAEFLIDLAEYLLKRES
jgi:geranylgeranyl diphosphate synthase type II